MKSINYIFLLVIFSQSVFAADWANEFPLHIYGDVSYIATVYEFIKKFIDNPGVNQIVYLGVTITVMVGFYKARSGDIQSVGLAVFAPLALIGLFFVPFATVHIVDVRVDKGYIDHTLSPDGGYQKVEGVPYAIAFFPASIMLMVNLTVDLIDNNWASVHIANKFSSTGFQTVANDIQMVASAKSCESANDPNVAKYEFNLGVYIESCISGRALMDKMNHRYVSAPDEIFPDSLNPANFPVDFGTDLVDYYEYNNDTQINEDCDAAYTRLVATDATNFISSCQDSIDMSHPTRDATSAASAEAFRQQIGDISNKIGSIQKMKATTVVARMVQRDREMDAIDLATDTALNSTLADMRTEGPAKLAWMARVLPDAINIITGLFIAAFPLLIIVQSFMGIAAYKAIANYFMGFFALYFNLVGLALVQNIISFYTAQQAQNHIVNQAGMPFSARYLDEFLIQQADMTGLAGVIGAASIVALTPLIFMGESRGFAAAMGAATGTFRGGVGATAQDNIAKGALEAQIDKDLLEERNGMSEKEAGEWLSSGGFKKNANMTALETFSQIQKGSQAIGAGRAASALIQDGNKLKDYVSGTQALATQANMKTAGFGNAMGPDGINNAGEVAFEDGQVMAENINATNSMRNERGYSTKDIGHGEAAGKFAQDMGTAHTGKNVQADSSNLSALIANSVNQSQNAMSTGKGLQDSKLFDDGGNLLNSDEVDRYMRGIENKSRIDANKTIGMGANEIDSNDMSSIQANANSALQSEIKAGDKLRENFGGRDLKGEATITDGDKTKSISHADMVSNEADGKLAGRIGSSVAYDDLGKDAFNTTARNVEYGALSQSLSTEAKIEKQDGVAKAVHIDTTEATMKAATQANVLDKTLKEGGAEKGLESSVKDLSTAIDNLAQKDGTLASGKVASDFATIEAHGDNYAKNVSGKAFKSARVDALQSEMYDEKNKDKLQTTFNDMANRIFDTNEGTPDQKAQATAQFMKDAHDKGIIDKKGSVTTGNDARKAWAEMEAGAASADSRFMLGSNRFNVSRDMSTGNALVNVDGSTTNKQGSSVSLDNSDTINQGKNLHTLKDISSRFQNLITENTGMSETSADHLATGIGTVVAGAAVNKLSKSVPGMDGESLWEKTKNKLSGQNSKSDKQTMNRSTDNNQGDSANNVSKHNNSFLKSNDIITQTQDKLNDFGKSSYRNVLSGGIKAPTIATAASMLATQYMDTKSAGAQVLQSDTAQYAGYGAMLGSVVPGVGTVVGGFVGGMTGFAKDIYDGDARKAYNSISASASSAIHSVSSYFSPSNVATNMNNTPQRMTGFQGENSGNFVANDFVFQTNQDNNSNDYFEQMTSVGNDAARTSEEMLSQQETLIDYLKENK